jgi:superfamily I DNA and/or RNA helicase
MKELGFLRDPRRLNVAITRGRRALILVGDKTVLRTCRHWLALLESCESRGCLMNADDLSDEINLVLTKVPSRDPQLDVSDEFYGLFS